MTPAQTPAPPPSDKIDVKFVRDTLRKARCYPETAKRKEGQGEEEGEEFVVAIDGVEVDLSDSGEITLERAKAMLRQTRAEARTHLRDASSAIVNGNGRTPSRPFKLPLRKKTQET